MIDSLRSFYTIKTHVKVALEEMYLEGQRNTALEGLFNSLFHN